MFGIASTVPLLETLVEEREEHAGEGAPVPRASLVAGGGGGGGADRPAPSPGPALPVSLSSAPLPRWLSTADTVWYGSGAPDGLRRRRWESGDGGGRGGGGSSAGEHGAGPQRGRCPLTGGSGAPMVPAYAIDVSVAAPGPSTAPTGAPHRARDGGSSRDVPWLPPERVPRVAPGTPPPPPPSSRRKVCVCASSGLCRAGVADVCDTGHRAPSAVVASPPDCRLHGWCSPCVCPDSVRQCAPRAGGCCRHACAHGCLCRAGEAQ